MSETLGKIERPEADSYRGKRKLYVVTLLFANKDAPLEYVEKFNRYWDQVREQLSSLENKLGKVTHVYHELVTASGEEGLSLIKELNEHTYQIVTEKLANGAALEALEDKELVNEIMDWERALVLGPLSSKVQKLASDGYIEALKTRTTYMTQMLDSTLGENEVGLLFITEGHGIQFPQDIEVFIVAPPALDEIYRWQREQLASSKEVAKEKSGEEKP